MTKTKIGLLGAGYIGMVHLEVLRRFANIDIIAVADTNKSLADEAAAKYNIPKIYYNPDDFINDDEIERLMAQTRHLTVLVNDLHVLAQAEARQLPLSIQNVDIAGLVKEVAADYIPLARAREIDLHVQLLGTLPPAIAVDKARMRQAVQNLLDNALQHTPDGGQIRVTVKRETGFLQIQVQDDGDGIAPDQLTQVFDRLYRGDPSRQRQGSSTGLGLAISKALIEAHGGTIIAESRGQGQGSTFTIELPL